MTAQEASRDAFSPRLRRAAARIPAATIGVALAAVFVVAFVIRLRTLALFGGFEPRYEDWAAAHYLGGVSAGYTEPANALAAGQYPPSFVYPPLYPFFLAVLKAFGLSFQDARVVQALLDSGAAVLLYALLRRLDVAAAAALGAALLYAVLPQFAGGSVVIMGEALTSAATIVVMLTMVWTSSRKTTRGWILLGFAGLVPALMRAEMVFVLPPLAAWAWLTSQNEKKLRALALVVGAFMIPYLGICAVNLFTHERFGTSNSVLFYAIFSGLGQFPNDLGYYANDAKASAELLKQGFAYHSADAERYWLSRYLGAWREHPWFVLTNIGDRIALIATALERFPVPNYGYAFDAILKYLPLAGLAGALALAVQKRWLALIILAGPLVVAIASLGWVYVEPRYVRYAALTYIFGAAFAVDGLMRLGRVALARTGAPPRWRTAVTQAAPSVALAAFAIWVFGPIGQLDKAVRTSLQQQALRRLLATDALPQPYMPRCRVTSPGVQITGPPTLIQSTGEAKGYQAMCEIRMTGADAVMIRYAARAEGSFGFHIGLLSADGTVFLDHDPVEKGAVADGVIASPMNTASAQLVIDAYASETGAATLRLDTLAAHTVCAEKGGAWTRGILWTLFPTPDSSTKWRFCPATDVFGRPVSHDAGEVRP